MQNISVSKKKKENITGEDDVVTGLTVSFVFIIENKRQDLAEGAKNIKKTTVLKNQKREREREATVLKLCLSALRQSLSIIRT